MKQTLEQCIQLAAARAVLAATGKSPRLIGIESRQAVLDWIYRWGYTSSTVVQLLLGRTSAGYAQKLARQGWLTSTKTKSGTPISYFTLTELGLHEAERFACALHRYPELDTYKVNQQQIRHYLLAQNITLNGLRAKTVSNYETERMFDQSGDKSRVKRPDIIWQTNTDLHIAVEIELSPKWDRDLDEFVLGITRALNSQENQPSTYNRFAIITDSEAIIERYRAAMLPGASLAIWKKNQRNHWVKDKTVSVPDWLINKIDFQLISK